jgi:hypothetical protein
MKGLMREGRKILRQKGGKKEGEGRTTEEKK